MTDQPILGTILFGTEKRDAIHVAIAPVIAFEALNPGEHVGLVCDGNSENVGRCGNPIGIIDPFFKGPVLKGQRCWLFLYQNSVTSLRHQWTHPAFSAVDEKLKSEMWLRDYAEKMNCYDDKEEAFGRLITGLRSGDLFARGSDLHGFDELDDADDLKRHAETYLGISINWGNFQFSCSC